MDGISSRRALAALAADQSGYFTAQQAKEAGYSYQAQHYHAENGDWTRVASGVYRLHDFPDQPREELVVLTLRSRNRTGEPQAVVSYETALTIHEISDANPAKIDLTVPPGFRKRMPPVVTLHPGILTPRDWEQRDGFRVTTPLRTIVDIASSPVSWPFLIGAVHDALQAGLVRKQHLLAAEGPDEMKARLRAALDTVENVGPSARR
jgi:predicted transcriptional regulator of viral defense system